MLLYLQEAREETMMETEELDYSDLENVPEPIGFQTVYDSLVTELQATSSESEPTSEEEDAIPQGNPNSEKEIFIKPEGPPIPGMLKALTSCILGEEVDASDLDEQGMNLLKTLCQDLLELKKTLHPLLQKPECINQGSQTEVEEQQKSVKVHPEDVVQLCVSKSESKEFNQNEQNAKAKKHWESEKFLLEAMEISDVEGRKDLLKKYGLKSTKKTDREILKECLERSERTFSPAELKQLNLLMADPLLKIVNFSNLKLNTLFKYLSRVITQNMDRKMDKGKNHQARRNFVRKHTFSSLKLLGRFYERCRRRKITLRLAQAQ